MLLQLVTCEECGEKSVVRGYGRVEFDWDNAGSPSATPHIQSIRLTIDCPHCGVNVQDHYPNGRPPASAGARSQQQIYLLKDIAAALRS